MDLNRLYFDHQILLMKADGAAEDDARDLHEVGASQIAGRIGCIQRALGADAATLWDTLAALGGHSLAGPIRHQQGFAA